MSLNGSANVKHSEAMSDEIITAMSTVCGASISYLNCLKKKKNYKACCPSYEMNAGSWQAWVNMMHEMNEYRAK